MATATTSRGAVERFHEIALLGMLASGYFALAGSLDWATASLMLGSLLVRVANLSGILRWTCSPRVAGALGLLCIGFYPLDQQFLSKSFLTATVHLVCFLAVIKILSASSRRDFAWVRVIALMELLAASLLSASPSFFLFLTVFLLCAVAAFSSGEILRSMSLAGDDPGRAVARASLRLVPRRLAVFSGALFAGILLMTAGLFFVLPRTARAALQRFVPQRYHLPGFANEISLGEIGEIKQRSNPVMHVRSLSEDGVLPPLRWRGAALTHFDGKRWFNPPAPEEPLRPDKGSFLLREVGPIRVGTSIRYQVQLSEIASDTLFFAGTPQTVAVNLPLLRRSAGGSIRVPRLLVSGLRYNVFAVLEDERAGRLGPPESLSDIARQDLLALPRTDRRIIRLARDMTQGTATQEEEAKALEQRLAHDYSYTLELPQEEVADPMAHFLFERKKGHCEYFASAMAVMLRTLGIPSRVATGFLYGVYNPVTGWQVIRASDAHSWVEAWIDGRGWTTFDPTPPDPNPGSGSLLNGAALLADALGQFWQDWVLSYDIERQVVLAERIGQSSRRVRLDWFDGLGLKVDRVVGGIAAFGVWVAGGIAIVIVLVLFGKPMRTQFNRWRRMRRVQRGEAHASDATLLYSRMLDALERKGFRKPPWVTPAEFARMIPSSAPVSSRVRQMTAAYNACRFGGRREAASQMVALLGEIERG